METATVSPQSIPLVSIVAARMDAAGTVSAPVDAGELLYAHFKHISGVPAAEGTDGISIDRLRALDNLIDRLTASRGDRGLVKNVANLSPRETEALISRYQADLNAALRETSNPYKRVPETTGLLLSTVA